MVDISKLTTGVNLPAASAGKFFARAVETSAFLRATGVSPLLGIGEIVHNFGNAKAYLVEEGGIKTVSNPQINNVTILPKKFVVASTYSDEIAVDAPFIVAQIKNAAAPAIGREVDATIVSSAVINGFSTLGSLVGTEIDSDADMELVLASLDGTAFGIVLSSAMLGYIRSLRNSTNTSVKYFDVIATSPVDGTINGFPYYVYNSAVAQGFIADWSANAVAGRVGDVRIKTANTGEIGGVNLLAQNFNAVITEARVGFGVKTGFDATRPVVAKIVKPVVV